jgi:hypothetical protein
LYNVEKSSSKRYWLPSGTSSGRVSSSKLSSCSRSLHCCRRKYPRCLLCRVKFGRIHCEWEICMRWVTSNFIQSPPMILHGLRAQCTSCMHPISLETFPWRNSIHPMRSWLAAAVSICEEPPPPALTKEVNDQVPQNMRYFSI